MNVLTYGTFDLLHYGHLLLLKRCSQLGDKLFVGVSTDEFCKEKGKNVIFSCEKRMEMVSDLRFVDVVFPENNLQQKITDIQKYDIDVFVLGSDYEKVFPQMDEYRYVSENCEIVFLPRTPNISTSQLKQNIL